MRHTDAKILMRPATAATLVAGVFALLAVSMPASALARIAHARSASFHIAARIPNHMPIVGHPWPIELIVTRGDRSLGGHVRYEFLFEGIVVSTRPGHGFRHGIYRDRLRFPLQAQGQPLTLRMLVSVPRLGTQSVSWSLVVRR